MTVRIETDAEHAEKGLAQLVLTVVELLRRVMEHEALRRIEGGSLSEQEIEDMGQTFLQLDQKMKEMCQYFGLQPEDLNLDLGPLGNLM